MLPVSPNPLLTCDLPVLATCRRFGGVTVVDRKWVDDENGPYCVLLVVASHERAVREVEARECSSLAGWVEGSMPWKVCRDIGQEYAEGKIPRAVGPFFRR